MNLKRSIVWAGLFVAAAATAAAPPAGAPAGSTGLCKDGSYTNNDTKKGACAGHKGVKDWYAAEPAKELTPAVSPNAAVAPAEPGAATTPMKQVPSKTSSTPVAGGAPDKVWVNSASKVYHCPGTKYYGTTKAGTYMTEAEAKAAGNHADHDKACS